MLISLIRQVFVQVNQISFLLSTILITIIIVINISSPGKFRLEKWYPELPYHPASRNKLPDARAPSTSETNQVWHNRNCRILYTTVSKRIYIHIYIYIYIRARNAELSMLKEFKHAWHVYFIIHVCPLTITNDTSYMVSRSRIGQIRQRKRERER